MCGSERNNDVRYGGVANIYLPLKAGIAKLEAFELLPRTESNFPTSPFQLLRHPASTSSLPVLPKRAAPEGTTSKLPSAISRRPSHRLPSPPNSFCSLHLSGYPFYEALERSGQPRLQFPFAAALRTPGGVTYGIQTPFRVRTGDAGGTAD